MKLSKKQLKKIIAEELQKILKEYGEPTETYEVGDYLEVSISDDGYDKSVEKLEKEEALEKLNNENEYKKSPWASLKALVIVEEAPARGEEDSTEDTGPYQAPTVNWDAWKTKKIISEELQKILKESMYDVKPDDYLEIATVEDDPHPSVKRLKNREEYESEASIHAAHGTKKYLVKVVRIAKSSYED